MGGGVPGIVSRRSHRGRRALGLAALLVCCVLAGQAAAKRKKSPPAAPLDLNSASAEQLITLPGIGPATAKAIVRFREKSGPFERVEDLLAIRGISHRKFARLRPFVTVKPAASDERSEVPKPGKSPESKSGGGARKSSSSPASESQKSR